MYETTRHQYLNAMGIDSYMPRCLLPNAPVPQECDWPQELDWQQNGVAAPASVDNPSAFAAPNDSQAPQAAAERDIAVSALESSVGSMGSVGGAVAGGVSTAGAVGASELLAAFEPEKVQKKRSGKIAKETVAGDAAEETSPALKFSLSVWSFDDLLVLDSRHSEKALPTEKLLLSMLQACGLKLGNVPKAQVLQWPMFDMPQSDNSANAAREMLGAFLDTLLESPVSNWWLMGADAFHLLPADVLPQSDSGFGHLIASDQLQEIDTRPVKQLLTMPSLAQMLERPQLKAKAWHAIRQTLTPVDC